MLTDATGKASAAFIYTAYGQVAAKTGTATTPLGYAGQYTDADTGLQYLRARFYDPATAQFLTRDPIEDLTGQPYVYAFDNPLYYGDPTGLTAIAATGAAGCAAGPAGCVAGAAAGAAATACVASAACLDAVGEVTREAEDLISSIFGSDDADDEAAEESAPYDPSEAEEECPTGDYWDGLNKEIGDARQSHDKARELTDKLGHAQGGRAKRALDALGNLLDNLLD
jgi:RHS repeat-associated protein